MDLNDIYSTMNYIIRSTASKDIELKIKSINLGYRELVNRLVIKNRCPRALYEEENLATTISTNYADLPADTCRVEKIWYASGSSFYEFYSKKSLEELQKACNTNWHNTSDTGTPTIVCVEDDRLYFDKHFAASDTDAIKIGYWHYPSTLVGYDRITVAAVGTFAVGDLITGSTSAATGTIYAVGATYLDVTCSTISGTFAAAETITCGAKTTTITSIDYKPQALELDGDKYEMAVATAGSAFYLFLSGETEAAEKDQILDNIVKDIGILNTNHAELFVRPA